MAYRWDTWDKKGLQRATKIGKTAARLFSRKGYLETTMDDIAAAAKTSKGGMYYYFPSKSEILFYILFHYMERALDHLEHDLGQIKDDPQRLAFIISRHIQIYASYVPEARVLLHEAHCLPPKYFKVIAGKERIYYQVVRNVLSGLLGRSVPQAQLTVVTFSLFGMCNWIYSWYDPKGPVTTEELSQIIYNMFMGGVHGFSASKSTTTPNRTSG